MIPRSMDAQNRARDLSSTILAASTPPQIAAACSSIDSFLRKHASDQSRSFFSIAFPSLLCRLFGFDNTNNDSPPPSSSSSSSSSSSWIDLSSHNPDLATTLFSLLSPRGLLLSSVAAVDRHHILRYIFPTERLPEWIKSLLLTDRYAPSMSDLSPLLKSKVKDNRIHLNVFEYYIFWFAYYPVCKGNAESPDGAAVVRPKSRRFRLEQWMPNRRSGEKTECNLYMRLLYAYLSVFMPRFGLGSCQPYRSSLLHYSSGGFDDSAFVQAEFLVHALVQFWMVDNDFSPLPVGVCRSFGLSFPFRAVLGEAPPTPGLGEVLKLLVKYLNCSLVASTGGNGQLEVKKIITGSVGFETSRGAVVTLENHGWSWNLVVQRPLYRFILRSFLFCPMGSSIKNASLVFSLWATYLTPWESSPQDFAEFEAPMVQPSHGSRKENGSSERKNDDNRNGRHMEKPVYSPIWESYVASNYLFYSSLVVHFLGFAHKFLHTNVEAVVQMVLKVLVILTASKELMDFLRKVDTAYHLKQSGPFSSYVDNVHKYVPSIHELLKDWEDGLCESDADGSFLHENWNRDLRLFSDGEDGAPKLLQLFILRAEHEIRAVSGDLEDLNSIRSKMSLLFGDPIRASSYMHNPLEDPLDLQHDRAEVFTPKHQPGLGGDVKYKGDWMRRPITDNEVAWLAKLLIRLSDWLNEALGLDRIDTLGLDRVDTTAPTYVDVPCEDSAYIRGPKEAFIMFITLIGSWLRMLVQSVVGFMRGHGMRINLRLLASKKFVTVFMVYVVASVLKKALWTAAAMPLSS